MEMFLLLNSLNSDSAVILITNAPKETIKNVVYDFRKNYSGRCNINVYDIADKLREIGYNAEINEPEIIEVM